MEDELWRRRLVPGRAELEYREALDPGDEVVLQSEAVGGEIRLWLTVGGEVRASSTVVPAAG